MKLKLWVGAIAIIFSLGMNGLSNAEEKKTANDTNQVYPQEDANRAAQPGPGYEQEGSAQAPVAGDESNTLTCEEGIEENQEVLEASKTPNEKTPAPGPDYIWVDHYCLPGGLWVSGFWRPRLMAGFDWVDGSWDQRLAIYLPGYWRPYHWSRRGYFWVPGYWHAGRWFPGLWRPAFRAGFVWAPGHWTNGGQWIFGHWWPKRPWPGGRAWAPGHWDRHNAWYPGHWRIEHRAGFNWRQGHYDPTRNWVPGQWHSARSGRGRGRR